MFKAKAVLIAGGTAFGLAVLLAFVYLLRNRVDSSDSSSNEGADIEADGQYYVEEQPEIETQQVVDPYYIESNVSPVPEPPPPSPPPKNYSLSRAETAQSLSPPPKPRTSPFKFRPRAPIIRDGFSESQDDSSIDSDDYDPYQQQNSIGQY